MDPPRQGTPTHSCRIRAAGRWIRRAQQFANCVPFSSIHHSERLKGVRSEGECKQGRQGPAERASRVDSGTREKTRRTVERSQEQGSCWVYTTQETSAGKDDMLRDQQADGSVEPHRRHSMQHAEQGRHPSNDEELLARATAINQSHSSDVIDVTK